MIMMKQFAQYLQQEESGQGMVEYAFIIMLIALSAVGALRALGTSLNDIFVAAEAGLG